LCKSLLSVLIAQKETALFPVKIRESLTRCSASFNSRLKADEHQRNINVLYFSSGLASTSPKSYARTGLYLLLYGWSVDLKVPAGGRSREQDAEYYGDVRKRRIAAKVFGIVS